jgi:hypothetical protein
MLLRARNDRRSGLGLALPGGSVSLFETPDNRALFGGQARFEDRAVGLALEWELGEAMGLGVRSRAEPPKRRGQQTHQGFEITVTNDKAEAVEVEIVPDNWQSRGFRILQASQRSAIGDAGYPAWTLRVPAGGTASVRYTAKWD